MSQLIVSSAPHIHGNDSVRRNMLNVIIALCPAYVVSVLAFGWSVLITTAISVAACVVFEYVFTRFVFKQKSTIGDLSAILTGLLLAFNLPSNLPWWQVLIGAFVAIVVAKLSFGGLGQNIFNPALVGRVFLLIAFPVQMTTWPRPLGFDTSYVQAVSGATPLSLMKDALKKHNAEILDQLPSLWDMTLGFIGGSFGEVSALLLLVGGIYLICTKTITWHIPVSILATVFCVSGLMYVGGMQGAAAPWYHLVSGGLMLGAIFMATDYVTSPMTAVGQIIYGVGIGLIVVVIRTWGAYPEGVSFAILIMNACTPLLNTYLHPKRFAE